MAATGQVTWVGPGLRLEGVAGNGAELVLDHIMPGEEREETGPRPMDLILLGLCGCTTMDVVSILQKKRQQFSKVTTYAVAERATTHPKVYTQIHLEFVVVGTDVSPQAVERAIELSQTKYCPASAMLSPTVPITTAYRIEAE